MEKTTDLTGAKGTRVWRMLWTLVSVTLLWVGGTDRHYRRRHQ
jgi:hypothetical protein